MGRSPILSVICFKAFVFTLFLCITILYVLEAEIYMYKITDTYTHRALNSFFGKNLYTCMIKDIIS